MVHIYINIQQQIPYSWRELFDSEPGEGDDEKEGHVTTSKNRGIPQGPRVDQGRKLSTEFLYNINMTRETQQMIIEGQKFNTQKKNMQTMKVFYDWMKERNYTIQDMMDQKIPFIHTEFMTWLTRTRKTKPSSAKYHASILNTMLSLIFGTVQVSTTAWRLTTQAISKLQVKNPRYGSTWDNNQPFEYCSERSESNFPSSEELQTKLASLLMSLCFVRMEEITNINLSVSIIDDQEQRAADLENISDKVQRTSYTYSGLKIGSKLIRDTLAHVLKGLFKHFEYKMQLQTPLYMNLLQNQRQRDSKMNKKFYIFAVNKEQDFIASALVKNHCMKQATQIISKQRGGARVSEADGLQQSPLRDDMQLSPQETQLQRWVVSK
ncbi:MAG: hypothetical protein EZS28_028721 [Streblomastix strix]|uniref:Tyr recombinase domain-containing protein n=1 Tax=Streblomastix strix TaxID=222440 RepID=A0A5J4V083_9EUKA|nr:MAG: hypothetical protein EZS28_028721 [Streblomastix strix]